MAAKLQEVTRPAVGSLPRQQWAGNFNTHIGSFLRCVPDRLDSISSWEQSLQARSSVPESARGSQFLSLSTGAGKGQASVGPTVNESTLKLTLKLVQYEMGRTY